MKLTLNAKHFVEATLWATKSYDHKDTTAYVALVVAKNGAAHLMHSNATSFMKAPLSVVDVDVDADPALKSYDLALDGRFLEKLSSVLSSLSSDIELSYDFNKEAAPLRVKTENGSFTVPTVVTTIAEEPKLLELGEVDDREYFDALQRLAKICDSANANSIPALSVIDLKPSLEEKTITMMATDRYVLSEVALTFEPASAAEAYLEKNEHVFIPMESALLIAPSKGLTSSTTLIHDQRGKKFGYKFADGRVALFTLKDVPAINYAKLKAVALKNLTNEVTLDVAAFRRTVQNIGQIASDEVDIFFTPIEEGLSVHDEANSNAIALEGEDVAITGEEVIKFNRVLLNKGLAPVSTAKVKLRWSDPKKPFVFELVMDDGAVVEETFITVATGAN